MKYLISLSNRGVAARRGTTDRERTGREAAMAAILLISRQVVQLLLLPWQRCDLFRPADPVLLPSLIQSLTMISPICSLKSDYVFIRLAPRVNSNILLIIYYNLSFELIN